eukprot:TRINITY_DN1799_c0_g5_i1.p1 TRINITY_DN1799_c0_g5~~TRINITY_DN1799_c0_g5_i1.p1  ORF type:complete len:163 (+),score=33.84 TRINITY_DN1799_c0_g5_i1:1-489(+)
MSILLANGKQWYQRRVRDGLMDLGLVENVDRTTFMDFLPAVLEGVEECDFVSIDLELTGLSCGKTNPSPYDTIDLRYEMLRQDVSFCCPIQFGLSLWTWNQRDECYLVECYNFDLFPAEYKFWNHAWFGCQVASLSFLSTHGFDFNQWIYKGIPHQITCLSA